MKGHCYFHKYSTPIICLLLSTKLRCVISTQQNERFAHNAKVGYTASVTFAEPCVDDSEIRNPTLFSEKMQKNLCYEGLGFIMYNTNSVFFSGLEAPGNLQLTVKILMSFGTVKLTSELLCE